MLAGANGDAGMVANRVGVMQLELVAMFIWCTTGGGEREGIGERVGGERDSGD